MNAKAWLLLGATLVCGMAQATCYTVYRANGTVLQQSSTSPVNLSEQIGDSVQAKFGSGATMIMSGEGVYCMSANERQQAPKSLADAVLQDKTRKAEAAVKKDAAPADATKTAASH
jgi:hypothetical protein